VRPFSTKLIIMVFLVALTGLIAWAILSLQFNGPSLRPQVFASIGNSGVSNPVTAVLLNFRGYDTLLEIVVLFLAVLGTWSLGIVQLPDPLHPAGLFLSALLRILLPAMVLTAGYLLWAGAHAPGGAFQAGAVLGGAGILLLLTEVRFASAIFSWPLRTLLSAGTLVFTGVALGSMVLGGRLLEYPRHWAGILILVIETAATLSIGVTLTVLFIGGRPSEDDRPLWVKSTGKRKVKQ